ncbi:uncharacterized protein BJ212DRAFT_1211557, partial [Suillus subaureus]
LSRFGFDFHSMFMPDFMHKFELSVWKGTLTHLLQILHAFGGDTMTQFNARFWCVPTFRRDIIQKFSQNMSNLTKLTVRDYEDLLQ